MARTADEQPRTTPNDALARAKRLQAFVDRLYGDRKPANAAYKLIAERRHEAAREASG